MDTAPRDVIIRPARRDDSAAALVDATGVADVLNNVIAQKRCTSLAGHWTPEAELAFLQGLGPRSEVFVAESADSRSAGSERRFERRVVGFQVLEPFGPYTTTMDHVALMGTYVHADFRRQGIGARLAEATFDFALAQGYEKAVIYVLAHNKAALAYYGSLGFEERGVLKDQTKIDGVYYDEVFMEVHLKGKARIKIGDG